MAVARRVGPAAFEDPYIHMLRRSPLVRECLDGHIGGRGTGLCQEIPLDYRFEAQSASRYQVGPLPPRLAQRPSVGPDRMATREHHKGSTALTGSSI